MMNEVIRLYTDGGCRGNGGINSKGIPCACGIVIADGNDNVMFKGGANLNFSKGNTNNKAEIYGMIRGLEMLLELDCADKELEIYSDSAYTINGITTWIYSWQRNGWVTADRQPVKNKELWRKLFKLVCQAKNKFINISYIQVKGHATNKLNILCDSTLNILMDSGKDIIEINEEELV